MCVYGPRATPSASDAGKRDSMSITAIRVFYSEIASVRNVYDTQCAGIKQHTRIGNNIRMYDTGYASMGKDMHF